jgi:hypothetical protein
MLYIYEIGPGDPQNHIATVAVGGGECRESRSTCGINISGFVDLDDRLDEGEASLTGQLVDGACG